MGKNKNRGERTGNRQERHAAAIPADDLAKTSAAQEQEVPVPGSEQHVSNKRGKKFGHN